MKKYILAMAVAILSQTSMAMEPIPSQYNDYCKDEAAEFLRKTYGSEIKIQSLQKVGSGRDWKIWVLTSLCNGYFVFDYELMEHTQCTIVQYGERTRFLRHAYADGECRDVLPGDVYF